MKMNKVVLGFAVIFASGSMLKGMELGHEELGPLKDAVNSGDIEKVKALAGQVLDKTALNDLVIDILDDAKKSEKMVEVLLAVGAEPNISTLNHAIESGSVNSITSLVNKMDIDDLNEENAEGQTAVEEVKAVVSSKVLAPLAKKGIVLTPGKEGRIKQGKEIDEASQKYKASGAPQRALRTTAAGEGRSVFKKPAAHTRTPTRRVSK